ncbi:MAG TPA: hypothetical protein PKL53_01510 [Methylotenera sp.]|nr:hypothetical protein [Methylotenera sp.]HPV44873.1 hypothetical protein [Methylotenera sp.]
MQFNKAISDFYDALFHYINNRGMLFGQSFEELISEKVSLKARQFNTLKNTGNLYKEAKDYHRVSDGF